MNFETHDVEGAGAGRRTAARPTAHDGAGPLGPAADGGCRSTWTPLVFTTDTTSYVWLLATGKPQATDSPDPPEAAALLLW